jgi:hypothetical protein
MLLKILPYALGTLVGVYLNYVPIIPDAPTLVGVVAGSIISPMIGIPLLVVFGIGRAIILSKKTDSRIRWGKKIKGLSKFVFALMGGSFFSCSFFSSLQITPYYLQSLFKDYNPIETPINDWNSFHYYNSSIIGSFIWGVVAIAWPILSWIIFKWIGSLSERIQFSDKEERSLEILQVFLLKIRKTLWLVYGSILTVGVPILIYLNIWKGVNGVILDIFPWLTWILMPVLILLILFIPLFSLVKAFDWDKKALSESTEASPEEVSS